ncbi:MAG: hypothetical protein WBQ08_01825 [Candidatus Sulfotelmatobacter sp.]
MKRVIAAIFLSALCAVLVSCSGSKAATGNPATPSVAGSWEFLAISNNGGATTGVEVALQEGEILVDGMSEPSGNVSATGVNQITFVCINSSTGDITSFGGNCVGPSGTCSAAGVNSLSGSADSIGGPFTFTYTESGNAFTVTGMLGSDGQSLVNGTYAEQTGSGCVDSGSVTGLLVPKLTGTYTGQMTLPDGTADTVTATLSESSGVLTAGIVGSAPEVTNFSLSGPVTGNAFALQGQFNGQPVTYNGYYEVTHNLPSVYFVNSTDSANPGYAGTLTLQQQ